MTTNATAPTWYNQVGNIVAGGTKIFSSAVKFSTAEGGVTIGAQNSGPTIVGTSAAITVSAAGSPTVTAQTPANGDIDQAITVSPTVTFDKDMATSTVIASNVQLRLYSDNSVMNSVVTYSNKVATIDPTASLANGERYYVYVSGAQDVAGHNVTAYTTKANQDFFTVAQADGTLAVIDVGRGAIVASSTRTLATADGTYGNGWAWTFNVTVPTSQTSFKMKFADWVSGANSITATNTIRYYSVQSNKNTPAASVTITGPNIYPATVMTVNADLDPAIPGNQIQVTVEALVPIGSAGGSYTTSYGVQST
jgi:hypothetical protein